MMRTAIAALMLLAACSPSGGKAPGPVEAEGLTLEGPLPNAKETSPLKISGAATAAWLGDQPLSVELTSLEPGGEGAPIAKGAAKASDEMQGDGKLKFAGEVVFSVEKETHAMLTLRPGQTEATGEIKRLRIPVLLEPAK